MRQIASVHLSPSNDMRRFLQTKMTVALGHRFKIYVADSRGVQCTSHPRIHLPKRITTAIRAWRRLIYPALCWHTAKRGLRRSGSTPSQRDRSARPPKDGRVCVARLFAWKHRPSGFEAMDGKVYSFFLSHLVDLLSVSIYTLWSLVIHFVL